MDNKKLIEIEVTYKYLVEVDEQNPVVREYADTDELVQHLSDYQFSVLPVIGQGVTIEDVEVLETSFKEVE